ncbi:MAG: M13 family peptidase, partial [Muribaculaceae bacterium]|nr:M13 family peptidase [Muribaculaceae bacterium]
MKKTVLILMMMVGITSFAQEVKTSGLSVKDMNLNVKPGEDFYEYAGGGWMKANPLTAEYSSYGVFNELAEKNREQLRELFAALGKQTHAKGSVGQKVTDLYNLAMDSVRLNKEGTTPINGDLAEVAAFKKANLTPFLVKMHLAIANPFFGIGVETDLKNSDLNVVYMSAGTSGLPDRDYYLNTDAESKKIQEAYKAYLAKVLEMCGYKKAAAKRAAKTIYEIEYKFAEAKMSRAEARDYTKLYNVRTVEQLQKDYPAVNWREYFDGMGLKGLQQVILEQPKVMEVANALMTTLKEQDEAFCLHLSIDERLHLLEELNRIGRIAAGYP